MADDSATRARASPSVPGARAPGRPYSSERRPPAHRARYRRILRFAAWHLATLWWFELVLPRIGLAGLSARTRAARTRRVAKRFHALAVELGGLMIKVGQFLSSRMDVLPPEVTVELAGLQDEVPAVPFADIRAVAEAELGVPLDRAFAWFDETPVAAASLGQAHRARLADVDVDEVGFADVVVKVQRPGIDDVIATDLAALRRVGSWLRRVRTIADRMDAPALIEEFAATSLEEIDYLHEAASAERFGEAFARDPRVAAPQIAWERTTRRVLTLSDVTAIKVNDVDALRAAGIDPSAVATAFADVMFEQVFTLGFFHADPHPGNIFVTRTPGAAAPWRLTFIDFGMMGEVPVDLAGGMRKLVIATASRDGAGLVEAVQEMGILLPSADTRELERGLTTLFARFGGMGFGDLQHVDPRELREFGEDFGRVARRLPVQLPERMLLLMRAVSLTSGLCSGLDARFNVWDAVEPYAARLMRDQAAGAAGAVAEQAWQTAGYLWRLPRRADSIITRLEQGTVTVDTSRLERRLDRIDRIARRAVSALLFAALLIGGAVLLTPNPVLGTILMIVSAVPLVHVLLSSLLDRGGPR